jgi:hypothetical protein
MHPKNLKRTQMSAIKVDRVAAAHEQAKDISAI